MLIVIKMFYLKKNIGYFLNMKKQNFDLKKTY